MSLFPARTIESRHPRATGLCVLYFALSFASLHGQATAPPAYGPYSVRVLADGLGLSKPLHANDPLLSAGSNWSLSLWADSSQSAATTLLAGVGDPMEIFPRYLGLREGHPFFWTGEEHMLVSPAALPSSGWHSIAVSVEGQDSRLLVDGVEVARGQLPIGSSGAFLQLAPVASPDHASGHFSGRLALVSLSRGLTPQEQAALAHAPANLDTLPFEDASKPWPVQVRLQAGYRAPQDPATLPRSLAPLQTPIAIPPLTGNDQAAKDGRTLTLRHAWRMAEQSGVHAGGTRISSPGFDASTWYAATIPGTVLTTLIDRGIYPDPDFGLNNMAIPESLSRQSFWFRTSFDTTVALRSEHPTITFNGINYRATIWLNGKLLGEMKGAFARGIFDLSGRLLATGNTLAVLIAPPLHPGIAHEQSIAAGPGENGGLQAIDGPTFAATEGWDWIPGIRDRNMGIWQDVILTAHGPVSIDNPQVVTALLPAHDHADITLKVPLRNASQHPVHGTLLVSFEGVSLHKDVTVPTGGTTVTLAPSEFPLLSVRNPRLWWPNGYGAPELYHLQTSFKVGRETSDTLSTRFGVREITYELSLLDATGHLRRVEIDPAAAALSGERLVDESHEAIRETSLGWVASLAPGAEKSSAVRILSDHTTEPALVIRVNGVRIACKGGSWGMEDMRKRVSRERMEPFFRLHREANLNIIRNWMGQNTEEIFYDLADEYGMLVWNDFWASTQDYNLEPDDSALFLRNAKETIVRFRNHPSIAIWCGRNEGVPPPALNRGLEDLIAENDGTRFYSASSNRINLHDSGPYKYQQPESYFTTLALGFAVEIGLPSPPTLESFQSFLPKQDQWPISDDWAYHDWHQGGNGDSAPFMQAMTDQFGAPSDLADFDRKAQLLNYVGHRAVFEGFNAHLWAPNSGRMLWMTQPAWPSTEWQIFSHDYDTQGSYFGVRKASEPIHIQLNLPDHQVVIVNNTTASLPAVLARAQVFDLASKLLFERTLHLDASANAVSPGPALDLQAAFKASPVVFVELQLVDSTGTPLSSNFYWLASTPAAYRHLNDMPAVTLHGSATLQTSGTEDHLSVVLSNPSTTTALTTKLTLLDGPGGPRILPAYYSDNYVSLLPGQQQTIRINYPQGAAHSKPVVALRGWNVTPATVMLAP